MKNFLKLSILNALLFISLPAFAQEKAGEKPVTPAPTSPAVTTEATPAVVSEEKTVAKASAFSILFAKSGIVADSNFTFFAPSDEAIATAGVNLDSVSVETAVALVNAHGVKLNVASTSIVKDTTFETLAGTKITLSKSETGILVNGTVAVVSADEKTAHGLQHGISAVLPVSAPTAPAPAVEAVPAPEVKPVAQEEVKGKKAKKAKKEKKAKKATNE